MLALRTRADRMCHRKAANLALGRASRSDLEACTRGRFSSISRNPSSWPPLFNPQL